MNIYFYYDVAKERITLQNTCSSGLIGFSTLDKENEDKNYTYFVPEIISYKNLFNLKLNIKKYECTISLDKESIQKIEEIAKREGNIENIDYFHMRFQKNTPNILHKPYEKEIYRILRKNLKLKKREIDSYKVNINEKNQCHHFSSIVNNGNCLVEPFIETVKKNPQFEVLKHIYIALPSKKIYKYNDLICNDIFNFYDTIINLEYGSRLKKSYGIKFYLQLEKDKNIKDIYLPRFYIDYKALYKIYMMKNKTTDLIFSLIKKCIITSGYNPMLYLPIAISEKDKDSLNQAIREYELLKNSISITNKICVKEHKRINNLFEKINDKIFNMSINSLNNRIKEIIKGLENGYCENQIKDENIFLLKLILIYNYKVKELDNYIRQAQDLQGLKLNDLLYALESYAAYNYGEHNNRLNKYPLDINLALNKVKAEKYIKQMFKE